MIVEREEGSVYIDTTFEGATDRRFEIEVVRLIRAAMHPFAMQLERIHVHVSATPEGHVCRLRAWAERGQTVVIESKAASRLGALETAADSPRRTVARRAARGTVATMPCLQRCRERAPASSRDAGLSTTTGARSGVVESEGWGHRPRVLLALRELDRQTLACGGRECWQTRWKRIWMSVACFRTCRRRTGYQPVGLGSRRPGGSSRHARDATLVRPCVAELRVVGAVHPPCRRNRGRGSPARARAHEVDWVVMSAGHGGCGRPATALARASGRPVLVAREPTSRSTLLIATDVSDELYAISSRAAALAEVLHAPVLAFHDVAFHEAELSSRVNA